jgi:CubicO group peptidase (beta-lactamase class C family)
MPHARFAAVAAVAAVLLAPAATLTAVGQSAASAPRVSYRFPDVDRRARLANAFPEADRVFRAFAEASRVPGIAYGILIDGELVHSGAYGVRELDGKTPVDIDTVFRIASMTKSFTALAIVRLRDEGRLSLDDPAERYVPELAGLQYPTADSPKITIRHLLSHAEGFPEDNPWGDRQLAASDADMTRMLRAGIPFSTAPGTAYEYSNFGFAILGRIVARVSGMPYAAYVTANILTPLGMTATTLEAASAPPARLAHGYRLEDGQWKEEPPLPDGAFGSMGGMLTSTRDLARYVGFLMSAWPPRDDPETGPIRRSSAREMQQVWRPSAAIVSRYATDAPLGLNAGGYGFGLRVWQTCSVSHLVAHSGGLPGFGSHMRWLPEHGVALVAMGNLTYTSWGRVADDVIDALQRTGGLVPRKPQPSAVLLDARDGVSRLVSAWDDALADQLAADNFFLDESRERRRAALEALRSAHGACRVDPGRFDVENALRGTWTMACDRGSLRVSVTLAPTMPPRVQYLAVRSILPMSEATSAASSALASLVGAPDAASRAGALLADGIAPGPIVAMLEGASRWGACRVGETLGSDGAGSARIQLRCDRGELELGVRIDQRTGKIDRMALTPGRNTTCAQ